MNYLPPEILEMMVPPRNKKPGEEGNKPLQKEPLTLSPNAIEVLKKRYLIKNERGEIVETPEELISRVARAVAEADLRYEAGADVSAVETIFYNLMARRE